MLWCLCFGSKPTKVNMKQKGNMKKQKQNQEQEQKQEQNLNDNSPSSSAEPARALSESQTVQDYEDESQIFTYRELATATNNFREESIIGRGGFGCVYKGTLESTGQEVAVKMLDHSGVQGEREFVVEVLMLSLLHHENLMRLIGYCAEGDQRLLVYKYMPLGSVEDHMHNKKCSGQKALDWSTRMKIAAGAAKGLEHLHNVADPPVIYRDLKTANILLDDGFKPKLSDFGLAKFGPTGDVTHVTTKVMGTLGYCAPDYAKSGKLTIKSDIYSFGVVMLELITGRKAIMDSSMGPDCFLGDWAIALFKKDNIRDIVDPVLAIKGRYMESTMRKALEVAFMCLREEASARPTISEVGIALNYIVKCTTSKKKKACVGSEQGGGGDSEKKGETSSSSPETPRILNGNNEERNVDFDRQRAVAEAKNWAESLRRKSTEPSSSNS